MSEEHNQPVRHAPNDALLMQWVRETRRALPLLKVWRDALVRRDLAAIDALNTRLQPVLQRLEQLRTALPSPSEPPDSSQKPQDGTSQLLQRVLETARVLDEIVQSAYDIIRNELDYTHALMAMLLRAAEPEHYAPTSNRSSATLMLNTEV